MWERVSVSSGPMWMNCDEVQQAVQPSHGTSAPCSPRMAPCIATTHEEKSPAARSPCVSCPTSVIRPPASPGADGGRSVRYEDVAPSLAGPVVVEHVDAVGL